VGYGGKLKGRVRCQQLLELCARKLLVLGLISQPQQAFGVRVRDGVLPRADQPAIDRPGKNGPTAAAYSRVREGASAGMVLADPDRCKGRKARLRKQRLQVPVQAVGPLAGAFVRQPKP